MPVGVHRAASQHQMRSPGCSELHDRARPGVELGLREEDWATLWAHPPSRLHRGGLDTWSSVCVSVLLGILHICEGPGGGDHHVLGPFPYVSSGTFRDTTNSADFYTKRAEP